MPSEPGPTSSSQPIRIELDEALVCVALSDSATGGPWAPVSDWVGKPFPARVHPDHVDDVVEILRCVLDERTSASIRVPLSLDGCIRWHALRIESIEDTRGTGAVLEVQLSAGPSATREDDRLEEELRQERAFSHLALEASARASRDRRGAIALVLDQLSRRFDADGVRCVRQGDYEACEPIDWSDPSTIATSGRVEDLRAEADMARWLTGEVESGRSVEVSSPADLPRMARALWPEMVAADRTRFVALPCTAGGITLARLEVFWRGTRGPMAGSEARALRRYAALLGPLLAREVEVRRHESDEDAADREARLESLVARLSRRFLASHPSDAEQIIDESLAEIGGAMAASRVGLLCLGYGSEGSDIGNDPRSFEFERPDATPRPVEPTRESLERFPWCRRQLSEFELLEIPDVSKLPPEADVDRAAFEAMEVASALSVPAYAGGRISGILTVHGDRSRSPYREAETRLLRILGELCTSALARGESERILSSSEERFRALTENMRDGICEIGEDGRILYASPSYAALVGIAQEALVGSDPLARVHPEDEARVAQMIRPGVRTRRQGTLVYRSHSESGSPRSLEATASAYSGYDGRPRVVVVARDVTDREEARAALERQIALETSVAELSRFFVDIDDDAIESGVTERLAVVASLAEAEHSWMYSFSTGPDGPETFDWWRDCHLDRDPVAADRSVDTFPYSTSLIVSGQIYRVPDLDSLPREAVPEREDMIRRGVKSILAIPIISGGRFVGCLGFETFDRETDWSAETIVLLRMAGEIFFSALRRRRAVRELHDSQFQLLQATKMEAVGTLAGGIAHDFNNHLAVMLANAHFVRQEVAGPQDVLDAIDDFERSADHCAQLTRSLLAFSRRSPGEILPVDAAELVRGVEGLVRPLLPRDIMMVVSVDDALGDVRVDRVQIQQVLVNLLVNARDAMPDGGPIALRAERRRLEVSERSIEGLDSDGRFVVLSVVDGGIGMDEETRSRVFEPFFTTKEMGRGTGLGLAMAYGIVHQIGGAISVESALGQGATFRVYLPSIESSEVTFGR